MLFDVGNLITLGIVVLILIFYRLLDKGNRSLDKARKYTDRFKEDLAAYIAEKNEAIKNIAINLDVERKAAVELMRRIQSVTREELAQKVQALTEVDERIRDYDTSIEALVQMTGRVQENLNRIRDESAFVEGVGKRVGDVKEKIEELSNGIDSLDQKLEEVELRFSKENADALEKAVGEAVSAGRSAVLDLQASAQTVERKLEEHREAVERLERGRESKLARDEERIEKLLTEAIDRAGVRADKVEDAAYAKLRDQAQERLGTIKTNFDEKIKNVQDTIKGRISDIQDQIKSNREEWKAEAAAVNARQKAYNVDWKKDIQELNTYGKELHDEWKKNIDELTVQAKQQGGELEAAIQLQNKELGGSIKKLKEELETASRTIGQEIIEAAEQRLEGYRKAQEEQFKQLSGVTNDTVRLEAELRNAMQEVVNRVNGDFARYAEEMKNEWENASGDLTGQLESLQKDLADTNIEITGIKEKAFENVSKKLKGFEDEFLENLSRRSGEIDNQLAAWQKALDKRLESIAEEAHRHNRELAAENDGCVAAARASLDEIRREIAAQTKLFEHTDTLKAELDRHVGDMNGNIERFTQLKNEITRFENQFNQIKRLEEDVNAKMTRFLSEKHRIEVMENDFNRLLQTSQSVEQKLAQVSDSDDVLQNMQVQIRRLEDVIKDTEEKYQRVERKSKTLQETTNGIDRNFKALQEGETTVKRLQDTVSLLKTDMDSIRNSVETLSAENEKAKDAAEKLSTLDESVNWLEKRIAEMNVAREGLARLATEMQTLDKDAQAQLRLTRSLLDRESVKTGSRAGKAAEKGAPPPRDQENIRKLRRQGWSVEEIAKTYGLSIGEVELVLELGPKDM